MSHYRMEVILAGILIVLVLGVASWNIAELLDNRDTVVVLQHVPKTP